MSEYLELVDLVFLPPLNEVPPHLLGVFEDEFASAQESEQVCVIPSRIFASFTIEGNPELPKSLQLFLRAITGKPM